MPKKHQPQHLFLAQMLLKYLGPMAQQPCQSVEHQQKSQTSAGAEWEVRLYQNPDRVVDLYYQDVPREEIAQRSFDEACREQDTIGVRTHRAVVCLSHLRSLSCDPSRW